MHGNSKYLCLCLYVCLLPVTLKLWFNERPITTELTFFDQLLTFERIELIWGTKIKNYVACILFLYANLKKELFKSVFTFKIKTLRNQNSYSPRWKIVSIFTNLNRLSYYHLIVVIITMTIMIIIFCLKWKRFSHLVSRSFSGIFSFTFHGLSHVGTAADYILHMRWK